MALKENVAGPITFTAKIMETAYVLKRLSIFAVICLGLPLLGNTQSEASNVNTGALLNSQWTCINSKIPSNGLISESKVAEMNFSPSSRSAKKSLTMLKFNKLKLANLRGNFNAVSILVFEGKKTYKRTFLSIQNNEEEQRIELSIQIPTARINKIVLNITMQNTGDRDTAASCIPSSVYQKMLPINSEKVTPKPGVENKGNPVLTKINSIVPQLEAPIKMVAPPVEWKFSNDTNAERLDSLKRQHQRFSEAFPTLYLWEKSALALVSTDATWLRVEMELARCQGGVIESLRRLELDTKLLGAGTSICNGRLVAFFLDRNMTDTRWSNLVGSEFGGSIQENSFKKSPTYKSGNFDWYSSIPNWYAEGGQTILSVIATTKESRNWSHQGRLLQQISPYCFEDTLLSAKCSDIGEAGVELLIALYGWDSAYRWFENQDLTKSHSITFKETFSDSYEKFQEWTLAYFRYLIRGEALPSELLAKLTVR